jgi:hypothetical protein
MNPAEFKLKWSRFQGKETAGYAEHFNDLCQMLGQPTPAEADPSGTNLFCFQKRVIKDAELFDLHTPDEADPQERGFADVWKKECFGWEYKGKKKDLDAAYRQLLRYRESLENPPLLVVCDFDRFIVKTNFNGTVQETHEFTNAEVDRPENLRVLRALFENPESLKPRRTTAEVTEQLAAKIAEVARLLQKRESVEIADAKTRKELNFAARKNLRIARFLNRIVFCLFAEDTQLLPSKLFTEILKTAGTDPAHFATTLEVLFKVMAKGGTFGPHKIRYFNGHLFEEATVFELNDAELRILLDAAVADWQNIQPSIMGTLFERALDESQLRREWSVVKGELATAFKKGKADKAQRETIAALLKKVSTITVLDPACGSGNFLYVSLQLLLDLEKEIITFGTQLGLTFKPQVNVKQLKAIEINPYAYELAQVSVQIGFLQWRRDNGFDNDRTPVLQVLDGFENKDALMHETFKKKAKNLKAAREEEHQSQDNLFKVYVERSWPECSVIVGNPPFIGNKKMRGELDRMNGEGYTEAIWDIYGDRLPATSDLCCYWFEKARDLIAEGKCQRAGLLATAASKQISTRRAFERIKDSGKIFFAVSDQDWFDAGAAIRICMVGFGGRDLADKPNLDGKEVTEIHADLTSGLNTTGKQYLAVNGKLCFMGTTKVGDFDIPQERAAEMLPAVNPHGKPNSDVLRPFRNGSDLVQNDSGRWIVDFGVGTPVESAAPYEMPFKHIVDCVKPDREKNNDKWRRNHWWLLGRTLPDF